jgi:ATP-dependent protease ClpP protease subunit
MIHQASGSAGGTLENVRATLAFQSELESESGAVLAKATGRQLKEIRDASRVDNWMNASAALEFGLVDHILPASAKAIRHSR